VPRPPRSWQYSYISLNSEPLMMMREPCLFAEEERANRRSKMDDPLVA
jgi:hypothetical protein